MNASVTSNTSSTIPNPVFRCQARKENSCVLEGWQAMVPIHGARWVIWSIHRTVYPYNVSFTGTKTINHGDLRFFRTKPSIQLFKIHQHTPVTVTPEKYIDVSWSTLILPQSFEGIRLDPYVARGRHPEPPRHISLTWF